MVMRQYMLWAFVLALFMTAGCRTRHEVDMTHEVKPIHITLDVNLKVERELDDFFGDIDQASSTVAKDSE
jgi:hypothetical protein